MNEEFEKVKEENIKEKEQRKTIISLIIFVVILIALTIVMKVLENDMEKTNIALNKIKEAKTAENVVENENLENDINIQNENFIDVEENQINNNIIVLEVTENNFEKEVLKSDKKVLIDFYADWCGPCKSLSPIVEEFAKENPDIKVVKIDVDENENLAYKYNANYIPLLVVIENGEEVNRNVGIIPKKEILELVK